MSRHKQFRQFWTAQNDYGSCSKNKKGSKDLVRKIDDVKVKKIGKTYVAVIWYNKAFSCARILLFST